MAAVGENMVIDAVDQNDRPIGDVVRNEVFRKGINFRVVHDLVFNRRGELLVQRLSNNRTRHPGFWGSSVAGYLFAGETYESAAQRRLGEELGVYNAPLAYVGKTSMEDQGCQKFIGVFSTVRDGPFSFDRGHIDAVEFLPITTIHELRTTGSFRFTPTFLRVLDFYENRR
jgi:isopentenyldiphosphate isomerase